MIEKVYTIEPGMCQTTKTFEVVRPFIVTTPEGQKHTITLNMNKLQDVPDSLKEENSEIKRFKIELSKIFGITIDNNQVSDIIKTRKFVINEG